MHALANGHALVEPVPEVAFEIAEPVMFLGSPGDEAFGHFLWDTVPMLALFERMTRWCKKILVEDGLPADKWDILYRLGLTADDIIVRPLDRAVRCKTLFVPSRLSIEGFGANADGLEILKRLRKHPLTGAPGKGYRLFVDRAGEDSDVRRMTNEEDVWRVAEQAGFERISPALLSLEEKIAAFGGAEIIVGQYGDGLRNHILSPAGTKILALHSSPFSRLAFDCTAPSLGHEVFAVIGRSEHKYKNSNFSISAPAVARALAAMID
jgi:capsular polysaccharide biosynthesis protein